MKIKTNIGYVPLEIHPAAPAHRNKQKIWVAVLPCPGSGNGILPLWGCSLGHLMTIIEETLKMKIC